jgi:hypothetical protein
MGGICLAAQQGLWSFPSARQANISVSHGAQIMRSDTLASPRLFGSQNLFTHLKQKFPVNKSQRNFSCITNSVGGGERRLEAEGYGHFKNVSQQLSPFWHKTGLGLRVYLTRTFHDAGLLFFSLQLLRNVKIFFTIFATRRDVVAQ